MNCRFLGKLFFIASFVFLIPFFAKASETTFNIDSSFDYNGRTEVSAFLHQVGESAYFYVEDSYYQNLDMDSRKKFTQDLKELSKEFDNVIYPKLTKFLGSEWNPGIDKDSKITILLTKIKGDSGGYFNEGDEYSKAYVPSSNEREMIYFNVDYIGDNLAKSYLAHEFVHLITFNHKNRIYGASEEVWLNELRAELAPTIVGYDYDYDNSNLKKRVSVFYQKTNDSLTEWKNESSDYGIINLFGQYLLDYYGTNVLKDSLQSDKIGIESLNYALKKNGFIENFSDIFINWSVTLFVNDCNIAPKYCYLNPNLKSFKISPKLSYLPSSGESNLTVSDYTKDWSLNWIKFIGGSGTLKIEFIGEEKSDFKVPYLLKDSSGNYSLSLVSLDSAKRGTVFVADFGKKYDSFILIPISQKKKEGFEVVEPYYKFIWSASLVIDNSEKDKDEARIIAQLVAKIDKLKIEIAQTQAKIDAILALKNKPSSGSCKEIKSNLSYGAKGEEVKCLQQFLKDQGSEIYPQGIISGNFLSLTKEAVIRFQEKYSSEILFPLGLNVGTGVAGAATRAKINSLFNQ